MVSWQLMFLRAFSLVTLFSLVACRDTPTQVVVVIDAVEDLKRQPGALDNVRLDIFSVEGEGENAVYTPAGSVAAAVDEWPMQHVLIPEDGDSSRRYLVRASGRAGFTIRSQASVSSGYVSGQVSYVSVTLPAGPCENEVCPIGQTCVLTEARSGPYALCAEVAPVEPGTTLNFDAGTNAPDAPDTPDSDAGPNEPETCTEADNGTDCALPEELAGPCAKGVLRCVGGRRLCEPSYAELEGTICGGEGTCEPRVCAAGNHECPSEASSELADGQSANCNDGEYCFDGSCSAECPAGQPCSTEGGCYAGVWVCGPGAPVCEGAPLPDGALCGDSPSGVCDAQDTCVAGECVRRAAVDPGTSGPILCRSSAGPCDVAEFCLEGSAACPADGFRPAGTVCGQTPDRDCLADPICDGENPVCPDPWKLNEGAICGPSANQCQLSSTCGPNDGTCNTADHSGLNGTSCGDGGVCTDGVCVVDECPQLNDCKVYKRNAAGDCVADGDLGDGEACATNDSVCGAGMCSAGACVPTTRFTCSLSNDSWNDCTIGVCAGGNCVQGEREGACVMGDGQCSFGMCNSGACVSDTGAICENLTSDQDPQCVASMCDASGGCVQEILEVPCDRECYSDTRCYDGRCDGQSLGDGEPCAGGAGLCNEEHVCELDAVTPIFSRVWRSSENELFVEVYNPTQRGERVRVTANGTTFSGESIVVGPYGYAHLPVGHATEFTLYPHQETDDLDDALDRVLLWNAAGPSITLPIERRACVSSSSRALRDEHANAGNAYNPSGLDDVSRGAWVEVEARGPSGDAGHTEIPSCPPIRAQ